jgi:hypothetical protein
MSSYRKPYYNNYNRRFNYNNRIGNRRYQKDSRPYYNNDNYYKNRSRSDSRNKSPKKRPYSKKYKKMFNMYSRYEHLSSSSSSSSINNEFFVDREKTCPFLLRIFYKINGNNSLSNFNGKEFPPELDIYTWEDADLKELAKKIHSALKSTILGMYDYYKFSRIYYDSKGTLLRDDIGNVVINDRYSKLNLNVKMTLKEMGFQIDDYFDINITSTSGKNS